jgi:hypothetical protein
MPSAGIVWCLLMINWAHIILSMTLEDSKKSLTLIVGPHKTGSTTIESLFYNDKVFKWHLHADKFHMPVFRSYFLGKDMTKNAAIFASDLRKGDFDHNSSHVNFLREELQHGNYSHVIVAAEGLSLLVQNASKMQPALQLMKSAKPMVRIVVSMRDIPDWIRSVFHHNRSPGQNFSEFVKSGLVVQRAYLNPHSVSYFFAAEGFSVVQYPFMNVNALICTVLTAPKTCIYVRNHMTEVPHLNNRAPPSNEIQSECADANDVKEMERIFVFKYKVPPGMYDWSRLSCP